MKQYKILVDPMVDDDISKYSENYEERFSGGGIKFASEIFKRLKTLSFFPKRFIEVENDTRMMVLKKFPFYVLYTVFDERDEVYVYAVLPCAADPEENRDRLR